MRPSVAHLVCGSGVSRETLLGRARAPPERNTPWVGDTVPSSRRFAPRSGTGQHSMSRSLGGRSVAKGRPKPSGEPRKAAFGAYVNWVRPFHVKPGAEVGGSRGKRGALPGPLSAPSETNDRPKRFRGAQATGLSVGTWAVGPVVSRETGHGRHAGGVGAKFLAGRMSPPPLVASLLARGPNRTFPFCDRAGRTVTAAPGGAQAPLRPHAPVPERVKRDEELAEGLRGVEEGGLRCALGR